MKKTLYVYDITSISCNYFSLIDELGIIEEYPLVVKKAGIDHYHFDKEDLKEMCKFEKDFAPYDENSSLAKNDFNEQMKKAFYHHIQSGSMGNVLTCFYKVKEGSIKLKWTGPPNPDFKR